MHTRDIRALRFECLRGAARSDHFDLALGGNHWLYLILHVDLVTRNGVIHHVLGGTLPEARDRRVLRIQRLQRVFYAFIDSALRLHQFSWTQVEDFRDKRLVVEFVRYRNFWPILEPSRVIRAFYWLVLELDIVLVYNFIAHRAIDKRRLRPCNVTFIEACLAAVNFQDWINTRLFSTGVLERGWVRGRCLMLGARHLDRVPKLFVVAEDSRLWRLCSTDFMVILPENQLATLHLY